ncbi:PAS domain-containing protein [Pelagibius sp. 7325]|uniref:PAS domain-containing protein n=1 Tax=Pelagibius sp. 7325 TaxID=3131994 RepID=UPI0030EF4B61
MSIEMADFLFSEFYLKDLAGVDPPTVHPRFTEMIRYLGKVAPEGRLPGRQHIDPCDFPQLLGLINLVDVESGDAGLRFRYRLVGERQRQAAGRDIVGLTVEEAVLPALVPRIQANMTLASTERLPVYDSFPMPHADRQFIASQRMYHPLASDGETVDMLLVLSGYDGVPVKATG